MIFYTNNFIPEHAAACARAFVILIRPQYRGDAGLLAHEQVHVAQFWRRPLIHGALLLLSKAYRLSAEVEAYRTQARYYPDDRRPQFAEFISTRYGLNISVAEALRLLRE